MTDYYPLIAKAVAGLVKPTGENRRALYERARTALLTQLRGVMPPLSESDIIRERLSLEEGIRKVEAEAARRRATETQRNSRTAMPSAPGSGGVSGDSELAEMARRLEEALRKGKAGSARRSESAPRASTEPAVSESGAGTPESARSQVLSHLEAEMAHLLGRDKADQPTTRNSARPQPREAPPGPTEAVPPSNAAADTADARKTAADPPVPARIPVLARLPDVVFFILCLLVAAPVSVASGGVGMFETALAIQVADALWKLGETQREQLIDLTVVPVGLFFWLVGFFMPIVGLWDDRRRQLAEHQTARASATVLEFRRPPAIPTRKKAPPRVTREQLDKLLAKGDLQKYLQQAQAFVADERTSVSEQKHDVLAVVATVYERLSPTSCGDLIAGAHAALRQTPEFKSALAVCRCPERFDSRAIAEHWFDQFNSDDLTFCPAMQAVSFVIAARAMEMRGDFAPMARAADEALRLTPEWPPARHWKVRAALHAGEGLPPDLQHEAVRHRDLAPGCIDPLYEIGVRHARRLLSLGRVAAAGRGIETLLRTTNELPDGAASPWVPTLTYWHAMVLARDDRSRATALLETLIGGPNSSEASTQLALMALAQGDVAAAEQRMAQIEPAFPAAVYVHGLIHARRGDAATANAMLDRMAQLGGSSGTEPSPYPMAAERLRAALAERAGDLHVAEERYNEILNGNSGQADDAVTRARLARHKLRQAYDACRHDGAAAMTAPDAGDAPFEWWHGYRDLRRLLTGSAKDVEQALVAATKHATPAQRAAWSEVALARLLQINGVDQAYDLLTRGAQGPRPRSQERLLLLIDSRRLLARIADLATATPGKNNSGRKKAWRRELTALAGTTRSLLDNIAAYRNEQRSDAVMERWRFLTAQAIDLARPNAVLAPDAWDALAPWPIARLPRLWSPDTRERAAAAADIATLLDGPTIGWSEPQRLLLGALSAVAGERDDEYLQAYTRLAPALDGLPVGGDGLWLGAARIWFQRKQWPRLLEERRPPCVANLANPRLRLLLGLAHAHAAAEDLAAGEPEKALQHAEEARSALQPLLAA